MFKDRKKMPNSISKVNFGLVYPRQSCRGSTSQSDLHTSSRLCYRLKIMFALTVSCEKMIANQHNNVETFTSVIVIITMIRIRIITTLLI